MSQQVGRLAFSFRDRVDIEPIHYVYADGYIYGRTQFGSKVTVLAHHPWIAFEVDEVTTLFAWRSVVVHGRIEFPDPNGSPKEVAHYAQAVERRRAGQPAEALAAFPAAPMMRLVAAHTVRAASGNTYLEGAHLRAALGTGWRQQDVAGERARKTLKQSPLAVRGDKRELL
jgi:nitroimidazol reductase NimA-like FMN-containing flavoprotein (pyridoxamine 5'-phosphate oxidase superfamily)